MEDSEIRLERVGEVLVFHIHGDMTAASRPHLREAYEEAKKRDLRKAILKFEPTAYINSAGLESLLDLFTKMKEDSRQVGVTGISEHFKKIFKMVGISRLVGIYPSVGTALKRLSED